MLARAPALAPPDTLAQRGFDLLPESIHCPGGDCRPDIPGCHECRPPGSELERGSDRRIADRAHSPPTRHTNRGHSPADRVRPRHASEKSIRLSPLTRSVRNGCANAARDSTCNVLFPLAVAGRRGSPESSRSEPIFRTEGPPPPRHLQSMQSEGPGHGTGPRPGFLNVGLSTTLRVVSILIG
jgi:hypothetical protein